MPTNHSKVIFFYKKHTALKDTIIRMQLQIIAFGRDRMLSDKQHHHLYFETPKMPILMSFLVNFDT